MANRIRNERLEIKLTKEEKALFEEKRKLAKCRNMSRFIRKCVLEKEIYQVDLDPFRDLQGLLSNATNNINQKCYLSEYNRVVTLYSLKHKYQTIIVRAMTRRLNGY